jgi:hypothetical protein
METKVNMFEVEIPGCGWVAWGTHLNEIAPLLPATHTVTRHAHPERPEYAPGECARRTAVVTTEGLVCGFEAVAQINFRDDRLCAVHYHFPQAEPGDSESFCAVVDCLKRKLTRQLGEPVTDTHVNDRLTIDYKWVADGLHVEVRACLEGEDELTLLANDPSACPWCK